MKKEDCFELGIVTKPYSFKGEVIIFLDTDVPKNYYNLDHVFLEINKQLVPFFIEKTKVQQNKQKIRVKFEGVETNDDTVRVVNKKVFLPLTLLPILGDNQFYYHEIVGFKVFNEKNEMLGNVLEVLDYTANRLISISINNKEALLPFNDSHIISVNKIDKIIKLNVPEGLMDLYI